MKLTKTLIIFLIGFTLLFNILLLKRIDELENKINRLDSKTHIIESSINSIPNHINSFLNKVKRLESWITPVRLDVKKMDPNTLELKASWQIKNYKNGSDVTFHYKINNKENTDFEKVDATMKSDGYFEVSFPVKEEIQPKWQVIVRRQSKERSVEEKNGASATSQVVKKTSKTLDYYVSMKNNDNVKSSELSHYNLDAFANGLYGILTTDLFISNDDVYNIHLHNNYVLKNSIGIKNVKLKSYNYDKPISTTKLEYSEYPDSNEGSYHVSYQNTANDFNRLVLEVEYDNGKVFTKEIYNK